MEYNASERKDIRRAERLAKLEEQQRREFITGIMSLVPGRKWMLDRLEFCHVFATSFNENPLAMAFAEGERNVGLQLLNDIMWACPDEYVEMMNERRTREHTRERVRESDRPRGDGGSDPGDEADGDEAGSD